MVSVERESRLANRQEELCIEFLRDAKAQFTPKAIGQRTHFSDQTFAFRSGENTEHADERLCFFGAPVSKPGHG